MNVPEKLKYTTDHEWVDVKDDIATIGITDFAQSELGDIIFIEFPEVGENFSAGDTFGTVEAVKTVADMFAPVSGEVIAVNEELESAPDSVNKDPYGTGWIVKIKLDDADSLDELMSAESYKEHIA
ncbi:MAG: glycine cleavage system protein GcvH [FCB group bacterium]|nr:glycine cleavage system protein GcvH [FCB group bacterium]